MEAFQLVANLVRAVVDADLVVVRPQQGMVGNGIQQGYALHLRTAGLLPEKLHGVTTGERWVDNQHVRFVRAKCLLQKLRSGNFDDLDAESGKPLQYRFEPATDDSGRFGNRYV